MKNSCLILLFILQPTIPSHSNPISKWRWLTNKGQQHDNSTKTPKNPLPRSHFQLHFQLHSNRRAFLPHHDASPWASTSKPFTFCMKKGKRKFHPRKFIAAWGACLLPDGRFSIHLRCRVKVCRSVCPPNVSIVSWVIDSPVVFMFMTSHLQSALKRLHKSDSCRPDNNSSSNSKYENVKLKLPILTLFGFVKLDFCKGGFEEGFFFLIPNISNSILAIPASITPHLAEQFVYNDYCVGQGRSWSWFL